MESTITFDEKVKGWTSFHSFLPDAMVSLNNRFFTIKDGQLYRHNEDSVNRNNFYGTDYPSRVSVVMNDNPSEIKVFKAISQEGTQPWDTTLTTYESDQDETKQTTLLPSLYQEKEGFHYTHIRRDETSGVKTAKSTYGLGEVSNISTNDVTLPSINSSLSIGDSIYKSDETLIGTVTAVNGNVLTLSSVVGLAVTDFIYGQKNQRIEGSQMRGYVMRIDLENSDTSKRELFAVNTEVFKSHR